MNPADLRVCGIPHKTTPRHHEPPDGWPPETFAAVTDALARVLVAAVKRREAERGVEGCGT